MVFTSKVAIECPSSTCKFAYFASSPDPAGKLRNHFNNIKVRDAEHDAFFQKPLCVFCGIVIASKTRKGLWKTDMNKHWLITHSAEFAEEIEEHGKQEKVTPLPMTEANGLTRSTGDCSHPFPIAARKAIK